MLASPQQKQLSNVSATCPSLQPCMPHCMPPALSAVLPCELWHSTAFTPPQPSMQCQGLVYICSLWTQFAASQHAGTTHNIMLMHTCVCTMYVHTVTKKAANAACARQNTHVQNMHTQKKHTLRAHKRTELTLNQHKFRRCTALENGRTSSAHPHKRNRGILAELSTCRSCAKVPKH